MQQVALVVDDSRVARMTLSKLLVAHDLKVIELRSGEEALVYLKGENVKPDIIFMDVMMGGMDGLTATQQIKADENLKHIPVVVCTGHDTDTDRAKSQEVGAVATLTKPPEADALKAIIIELARPVTSASVLSPIDTTKLMTEIRTMIQRDLVPTMQHDLRGVAERVSRQVSENIVERRITEQVTLLNNNTNEQTLLTNVMNKVEWELLPEIHKNVREMVEEISHQRVAEAAKQIVAEQVRLSMDDLLPALKTELLTHGQRTTEDLASSIAKHTAQDTIVNLAEKAVQNAAKESDLPRQIMIMLNAEGQIWRQRHEQEMFELLMQRVEAKFPVMAKTYLDDDLTQVITSLARTTVDEALAEMKMQTEVVAKVNHNDVGLNTLKQQVVMLKMGVIGISVMVLLLAIAVIF